jgi:hypothetical protein
MIQKKHNPKEKTSLKQQISNEITQLLNSSLDPLKKNLGEKKFNKRVKKVAKFLSGGVKVPSDKIAITQKETLKKEIKKSAIKQAAKVVAAEKAVKAAPKKESKVIVKKAAKVAEKK